MPDKTNLIERIVFIRNILYKCFLISLVYYLLVAFFYILNKGWTANYAANLYNLNQHDLSLLVIYFIGWMKMFTFYIFLVPALALHWTSFRLKRDLTK